MKLNNSDVYEHLCNVKLTEDKFPIAYKNKLNELIDNGMSEEDARNLLADGEIELELYYSYGYGLFAVESGAIDDGATIFDPYTGKECDNDI